MASKQIIFALDTHNVLSFSNFSKVESFDKLFSSVNCSRFCVSASTYSSFFSLVMATNNFINLKMLSLNVNGLRNITKRKAIFLFCRRSNANLIFLQETHSSEDDHKFWKSQWGDHIYLSHASNNSAGVAILFNKFKGDVIESHISEEGRWIILVLKVNNVILVVNNIYGHNNNARAKNMILQLTIKLKEFKEKYKDAHLIIGGDLNDAADG